MKEHIDMADKHSPILIQECCLHRQQSWKWSNEDYLLSLERKKQITIRNKSLDRNETNQSSIQTPPCINHTTSANSNESSPPKTNDHFFTWGTHYLLCASILGTFHFLVFAERRREGNPACMQVEMWEWKKRERALFGSLTGGLGRGHLRLTARLHEYQDGGCFGVRGRWHLNTDLGAVNEAEKLYKMSLAAADKLLKIFDALKNFREGIPVPDPNPLAKWGFSPIDLNNNISSHQFINAHFIWFYHGFLLHLAEKIELKC